MNVSFENPRAFWFLLPLIPMLILSITRYRQTAQVLVGLYRKEQSARGIPGNLHRLFFVRLVCYSLAWICLVVSFSAPYWGTESVPVRRQGNAVSFVFDVSQSMTAPDIYPSRLTAAAGYAGALLSNFDNIPVSVVLTKGTGTLAIPQTRDYVSIYSLLESLSPSLLTAPGSDIGKGIEAAIRSFPVLSSEKNAIVVFTDGDETTTGIKNAVFNAVDSGITVILVGFGRTDGIEILAGDGKTPVETALKEKKLESIAAEVQKKETGMGAATVLYLNALSGSSALKILDTIAPQKDSSADFRQGYDTQPKNRYDLFLLAAFISFFAGIIMGEFRFPERTKSREGGKK